MRKIRGKRRYYKKLTKNKPFDWLDLSDEKNNWFDFFHHHIDNSGLGNKSWISRKQHLDSLFDLAEKYKQMLSGLNRDFQFWILIDELDSMDDAIYIHTENPNKSDFPIKIKTDIKKPTNNRLLKYLNSKGYKILPMAVNNGNTNLINYYLYDSEIGINLE